MVTPVIPACWEVEAGGLRVPSPTQATQQDCLKRKTLEGDEDTAQSKAPDSIPNIKKKKHLSNHDHEGRDSASVDPGKGSRSFRSL